MNVYCDNHTINTTTNIVHFTNHAFSVGKFGQVNFGVLNGSAIILSSHYACHKLPKQCNGLIVFVARGKCPFITKLRHAKEAHAKALVIIGSSFDRKNLIRMEADDDEREDDDESVVNIPILYVTHETLANFSDVMKSPQVLVNEEYGATPAPATVYHMCSSCVMRGYRFCGNPSLMGTTSPGVHPDEAKELFPYCTGSDSCHHHALQMISVAHYCPELVATVSFFTTTFMLCCIVPSFCAVCIAAVLSYRRHQNTQLSGGTYTAVATSDESDDVDLAKFPDTTSKETIEEHFEYRVV